MHENEPLPPLERKLRAALGRYAAEQALRDTEHIVRRLLTDARLRTPARSEHLVTVSADGGPLHSPVAGRASLQSSGGGATDPAGLPRLRHRRSRFQRGRLSPVAGALVRARQ